MVNTSFESHLLQQVLTVQLGLLHCHNMVVEMGLGFFFGTFQGMKQIQMEDASQAEMA